MIVDQKIQIGSADQKPVYLLPSMANRHGLIAGATGTGKTTTLKVLAEGFSDLGIPVFLSDIKGDVSSLAMPNKLSDSVKDRLQLCGIAEEDFVVQGYPVRFFDVFGSKGIPVRALVSDFGPLLLSRLLSLTPAQSGILNIVFSLADDNGWELMDLKDLKALIQYVNENRKELSAEYGNITSASCAALLRGLVELENQADGRFFGTPEMEIEDWFVLEDGRGVINLLEADQLFLNPSLYSAFMLWLLSELYESLPEEGDLKYPKMVFFFDEAHLLFKDTSKALRDKIAQIIRLIRSKGISIFFVTQNPSDIDDEVLSQLSTRIIHGMNAYTPAGQKQLKAAAASFRPNPAFDTLEAMNSLGIGEAMVSTLDEKGVLQPVEKTLILPSSSSFDALSPTQVRTMSAMDPMMEKYAESTDPISAFEILEEQKRQKEAQMAQLEAQAAAEKEQRQARRASESSARTSTRTRRSASPIEKAAKSAARSTARSFGRQMGQSITRNVLGTSNKTAQRAAGNFAGSLLSDLASKLFG